MSSCSRLCRAFRSMLARGAQTFPFSIRFWVRPRKKSFFYGTLERQAKPTTHRFFTPEYQAAHYNYTPSTSLFLGTPKMMRPQHGVSFLLRKENHSAHFSLMDAISFAHVYFSSSVVVVKEFVSPRLILLPSTPPPSPIFCAGNFTSRVVILSLLPILKQKSKV